MNTILLTQDSTFLIGQVAWLLGKIMEGIFKVIDLIGIPNVGLAIILFTIVVNLLMMPLTIKQQKFSKLSAKMQPEVDAIRAKYKNKNDQDSQMAMNQEIQFLYAKYGVSPSGSCVQLLIQMPILFALYRVIYAMPAYVGKIGNTFSVLAKKIIETDNGAFLKESGVQSISQTVSMYTSNMNKNLESGIIDVLNRLSSADMSTIANHYGLNELTYDNQLILSNESTVGLIDTFNNFLGLNIGNSPSYIVQEAFANGAWLLVISALMIPILSAVTQWINVKLMPQQQKSGNEQADSMMASMKTMNLIMPLVSAWFCFSMPAGMGIYWVASSVVRGVLQVVCNKKIDKMNFDEIVQKNSAKSAKKIEKIKAQQERMNAYANMNTRNIQGSAKANTMQNKAKVSNSSSTTAAKPAKEGSMMSKANMVKNYNEKNNK